MEEDPKGPTLFKWKNKIRLRHLGRPIGALSGFFQGGPQWVSPFFFGSSKKIEKFVFSTYEIHDSLCVLLEFVFTSV